MPSTIMQTFPFITDINQANIRSRPNNKMHSNKALKTDQIKPTRKPVKLDEKPPFSYATLIAHAILSSKHRKLTLSEIYRWISERYPCYSMRDNRWQNSIRHNLSLQKAFVKQRRESSSPISGKGCLWAILPGYEQHFINNLTKGGLNGSQNICHQPSLPRQFKKLVESKSKKEGSHLYTIFRMNPTTTTTTTTINTTTHLPDSPKAPTEPVEYDSDNDSGIGLDCYDSPTKLPLLPIDHNQPFMLADDWNPDIFNNMPLRMMHQPELDYTSTFWPDMYSNDLSYINPLYLNNSILSQYPYTFC